MVLSKLSVIFLLIYLGILPPCIKNNMSATRSKVLSCFRQLHRARRKVFNGDKYALHASRNKINEEFRKNMTESDPAKIEELIKIAEDSNKLLRSTIVQAREVREGVYRVQITDETELGDNIPYDPNFKVPEIRKRRRRPRTTEDDSS